eukprot:482014-Rhodomonas_salina.2
MPTVRRSRETGGARPCMRARIVDVLPASASPIRNSSMSVFSSPSRSGPSAALAMSAPDIA